jgi:hypothetical protein
MQGFYPMNMYFNVFLCVIAVFRCFSFLYRAKRIFSMQMYTFRTVLILK